MTRCGPTESILSRRLVKVDGRHTKVGRLPGRTVRARVRNRNVPNQNVVDPWEYPWQLLLTASFDRPNHSGSSMTAKTAEGAYRSRTGKWMSAVSWIRTVSPLRHGRPRLYQGSKPLSRAFEGYQADLTGEISRHPLSSSHANAPDDLTYCGGLDNSS